jgi:hypothetical protein
MSEYAYTITMMMALAYADEGDRITSTDLAECETAACIIQDLEAEKAELENIQAAYVQSTVYWRDQANRLREFAEWCADLEAARDLWGDMSDLDWFVAIEEKAKEALQENSDE